MRLDQIPEFMLACYKARRVPFFWGQRGVGKSDGVAQGARFIAEHLVKHKELVNDEAFGFIDLRLGTQEVGDLIGIPRVREIEPGVFRTVHSEPEWWPAEGTRGIVFLDEFNRAGTNDVIQAMFQFVLGTKDKNGNIQRYLHTHKLPEGWCVICAGNPDTSEYVVQSIDTAMLDRFIQIAVEVQKSVSVKWMKKNLECDEIWKFVQSNKDALGKPESYEITVAPSPRSYEIVDDMLKAISEEGFDHYGLEVICGLIGDSLGKLFYTQLKNNVLKPIPAQELMNVKEGEWEKYVKDSVAKYLGKQKAHLELIDVTLTDILGEIETATPTKLQADNVTNFLSLIPPDMAMQFYMKGIKLQEKFVPLILCRIGDDKNEDSIKYMQAMGYPKEVLDATVDNLTTMSDQYKAETGIK